MPGRDDENDNTLRMPLGADFDSERIEHAFKTHACISNSEVKSRFDSSIPLLWQATPKREADEDKNSIILLKIAG